jgi:hypothetical protein
MSQAGMTFGTCQHVSSRVQCGPMESGFAVTVNAAQPLHFSPQQACTICHCGPGGLDHVLAPTRPKAPGSPRTGARIESPTAGTKDRSDPTLSVAFPNRRRTKDG